METHHDTKTRTVMGRVCADDSGLSKGEPTPVMLLVIFGCYSLVSRIPNKSIIAKTPKLSQASSLCSTQPDTRGDTISTIHRGFIGLGLDYASPAQVVLGPSLFLYFGTIHFESSLDIKVEHQSQRAAQPHCTFHNLCQRVLLTQRTSAASTTKAH